MSRIHKKAVVREVIEIEVVCDGPNHISTGKSDSYMQCHPLSLSGGYGSSIDTEDYDFCDFDCLKDWLKKRDQLEEYDHDPHQPPVNG